MTFNTEVLIFSATEAFQANPEISTKALKRMLEAEGSRAPAYYGLQTEDPSTGYIILNWDTYESHKAFASHPSFPEVAQEFRQFFAGNVRAYDAELSGPAIGLEKPVTEVAVLNLKAPENREPLVDILTKYAEANGNRIAFGPTRQDENKYILIGGWSSIDEHREVASKPEFAATRTALYTLVDREHLYHTALSSYRL